MKTSLNVSAFFFFAVYALLLCQQNFVVADERLTLYDRNKRNLQSQGNYGDTRYQNGRSSQRQYYGGRDYYYDDNQYQDGRDRTVGRPTQPWE